MNGKLVEKGRGCINIQLAAVWLVDSRMMLWDFSLLTALAVKTGSGESDILMVVFSNEDWKRICKVCPKFISVCMRIMVS